MTELRGLYTITPSQQADELFFEQIERALRGGVGILQYRDKSDDHGQRLQVAGRLAELCRQYQVLFIINDDLPLARAVSADGVHLGRQDMSLDRARQQAGDLIIGISCYNDLSRALDAQASGADYVAFGRFFPSRTKPDAVKAQPDVLRQAGPALNIPVVAIGGITLANAAELVAAGADAVAVIDGLFAQADVEAAARGFARMFV